MEFDLPKDFSSIIKVIGVGGGGSNAVNHMYNQGIKGVDFIVCNTDKQALDISPVPIKIQLGASLTEGLGAGAIPEIGKNAAIENIEEIRDILSTNTKMVFVTAGMGGGTGTGAAPVIAQIAKEMGILTVGIVTVPFNFEGRKRRQQAEEGLESIRNIVDTLLVINNERLREISGNLTLTNAFAQADDILTTAAKGIAEIISVTGNINVDYKDVNTVMKDSGVAIMGSAVAEGDNRAIRAVQDALNSPLLNDNNIRGAKHVLLNITYDAIEVTMDEISAVTDFIQDEAGSTADVIFGYGHGEGLGNGLSVTIIATGFNSTGFEPAPERKITVLEDEPKKEIVSPLNNPTEVSKTIEAKQEEPYLKENAVEITSEIESPVVPAFQPEVTNKVTFELEEEEAPVATSFEFNFEDKKTESTDGKIVHDLDDEKESSLPLESVNQKSTLSPEDQQRLSQERYERIQKYTSLLRKPEGINELEKEPAYQRRNIQLDNSKISNQSSVSKFNISTDENGTSLKSNNSFLHDNVD